MEKWEEGYYITAMAGSATGSSLVVMSKGTPYTQQSYKVSGESARRVLSWLVGGCWVGGWHVGGGSGQHWWRVQVVLGRRSRASNRREGITCRRRSQPHHLWLSPSPRCCPAASSPCSFRLLPLQVDQQEVEGGLLWCAWTCAEALLSGSIAMAQPLKPACPAALACWLMPPRPRPTLRFCSDGHGHQPLAVGCSDEPQRRLCGPGAGRDSGLAGLQVGSCRCWRLHVHTSRVAGTRPLAGCLPSCRPCAPAATHPPLCPPCAPLQCVELDFQYPSEGIHRRWDAGYRITSCAATPDQAAFVLRWVFGCWVGLVVEDSQLFATAARNSLTGAAVVLPARLCLTLLLTPHCPLPLAAAYPSGGRWMRRRKHCAPRPSPAHMSRRSGPRTCT